MITEPVAEVLHGDLGLDDDLLGPLEHRRRFRMEVEHEKERGRPWHLEGQLVTDPDQHGVTVETP